jgi:hypothetical protein
LAPDATAAALAPPERPPLASIGGLAASRAGDVDATKIAQPGRRA